MRQQLTLCGVILSAEFYVSAAADRHPGVPLIYMPPIDSLAKRK